MIQRPTGADMPVYASLSTMRQQPTQDEIANGVIPLDTLPANWWNWLWNTITRAQNDLQYNDEVIFTEINNVLAAGGITPNPTSDAQATHDQLIRAINIIKNAVATTTTLGVVKSLDTGTDGTVCVNIGGTMNVNGFGDLATLHTVDKDTVTGAINEVHDEMDALNTNLTQEIQNEASEIRGEIGTLSSLTTTAKGSTVAAINELQAEVGGKAPTMHASAETTYGIGNADNYGHVKLTDAPGPADAASGTAATPKLVQDMVSGGLGAVNAVLYTFVVDSNEKLAAWANNDKASGQDYTSVLIRKGEWTSNAGVNLTTAGTKVVVGEPGSKLVFNNVEKGLYYTTAPTGPDYYMRDVTVTAGTGTGNGSGKGYGFNSCTNLTNCTGTGNGNGYGYGFYSCKTVIGCKAGKHCTTSVFQECYASSSKKDTYSCADTANGGFNNTTNPSA